LEDKAKTGAMVGAIAPALLRGAANVIKPSASAIYNALADAGVNTTIGQRMGGFLNSIEDKSQSIPFVGDFISKARNRALESWNEATLNEVVKPVGATVTRIGHDGVAEAGDILSNKYNEVLGAIKGVTFDPAFQSGLGELSQGAQSLTPSMASRFGNIVKDEFQSRLSPANGMDAETLKKAASSISALARKYSGSSVASEQELGGALNQMDSLINQQIQRSNPTLAPTLNAIDTGWANLVRVEGAAKAAAGNKVNTGIFTPSQLMTSVRASDQSVRDRATARGQALMQDWAQNGLKVIGDKIPDSGTAGRTANLAAIGALATNPQYIPAVVAGVGAGAAAYSPLGQKALVGAATNRPPQAQLWADALRKFVPLSGP
jgi:hypothetical protein